MAAAATAVDRPRRGATLPDQRQPETQIVFGLDVNDWKPGEARTVDAENAGVFGYPVRSLRDLKPASTPFRRCSTAMRLFSAPMVTW